jgi:DNA repair protein RadA/Sms
MPRRRAVARATVVFPAATGPSMAICRGVTSLTGSPLRLGKAAAPQKARSLSKARAVYFCSGCGFESPRWLGRCPQCDAWNSFDERPFNVGPPKGRVRKSRPEDAVSPVLLREIGSAGVARLRLGMEEFDAVLGGGIVRGSLTLVGGPPGIGKSTLALQVAARLAQQGEVIYVCGEESAAQVKLRAERIYDGPSADELLVYPETNLRVVLDALEGRAPLGLIVDSIQTVWLPESEAYAGSVTQIRDCTQALMEYAKRTGCATFIVGHITKDGAIAGPRLLEHLVDTVLYFEGESSGEYRILRAYKNRFGSIDEICVFTMRESGLREVANPSELFLGARTQHPSGSCVVASIVGSRPVLIEIQALVGEATYGTPRRLANNLDQQRLAMIIAVLERRAGFSLGTHDVYASVAGGLRVAEPAADLGIALAIASSFRNVAIPPDVAVFGELGLSGEVRRVAGAQRRVAEARKLGYTRVISPATAPDIATAIREVLG